MVRGEIVEKGTHKELLENKGKYYQLWEMQQGNFKIDQEENTTVMEDVEVIDEEEMMYVEGGGWKSVRIPAKMCGDIAAACGEVGTTSQLANLIPGIGTVGAIAIGVASGILIGKRYSKHCF